MEKIMFSIFIGAFILAVACDSDPINQPKIDNPLPVVTTDSSSSISAYSVIVYGTIQTSGTQCSYYFDYGTTASYGNESAHKILNSGIAIFNVCDTLLNLQSKTNYHYRIVCTSGDSIVRGDDQTFTTIDDNYFPNNPGSQWTYSYFDAISTHIDTIDVHITNAGLWEYIAKSGIPGYPTYNEEVFVSRNVVQINTISSESRIYIIPFVAGNIWHGPPPQYTFVNYSVTSLDSIVTPAGKFYGAYKIHLTAFNGGNTTFVDDRVFVPMIGFVTRVETLTGSGIGTISSNSWKLISYNIIQ